MPTKAVHLHVHLPYRMVQDLLEDPFRAQGLHPEIAMDALSLDTHTIEDFARTALAVAEAGLSVSLHAPFLDLAPGSGDPKIRDVTRSRFLQVRDLLPLFHPRAVVCHAGYDDRRYLSLKRAWMDRSLAFWGEIAREFQNRGALLLLENVYERHPEDLLYLVQGLQGEHVGICLDTGHQSAFSRVPLQAWIEVLGPYLRELHLHDNHGEADEHLPLGRGIVDFEGLFRALEPCLETLEIVTLEPHSRADMEITLDCFRRLWPWGTALPSPH